MVERFVGIVGLASLCFAFPARADVAAAKAAEDRAFSAIEEERWCDALHGFLEANRAAPSVDLIFNAALAADEAQDRKGALKLYVELLGAYPDSDRGEAVNGRISELTAAVQNDGPGTACPEPAAAPEPEPPPVEETPTATASAEEVAAVPGANYVLPWTVAGIGVALAATGVVVAVVGGVPYFDFVGARDEILALEKTGGDVAALQRRQDAASEAWTAWGELTVWGGVTTAVIGLGVMTAGVVWGLLPMTEE